MNVPDDLRYTSDHEWAKLEGKKVTVGVTDFAQDSLGDVVFVQLPELNSPVKAGQACGEVESTKSVSDIYAPVDGIVVEVNTQLNDNPERLNDDPYGKGWICVIELDDISEYENLLSPDAYRESISE